MTLESNLDSYGVTGFAATLFLLPYIFRTSPLSHSARKLHTCTALPPLFSFAGVSQSRSCNFASGLCVCEVALQLVAFRMEDGCGRYDSDGIACASQVDDG